MSDTINDGGPAFPVDRQTAHGIAIHQVGSTDEAAYIKAVARLSHGMTLRQYAAIKLKVPNSGTDWLDDMIRESLRNDIAAKAMPAIYQQVCSGHHTGGGFSRIADVSYEMADAMLKAQEA